MESLASRFRRFMSLIPSVENIDLITLDEAKRKPKKADYLCMGRKIIVEQKEITKDQTSKIQAEIDRYEVDESYPLFYGERHIEKILEKIDNSDTIRKTIYSKITKLIEDDLSEADKQIASTASIFDLQEYSGVLIILNESVPVLSPQIVIRRIGDRLTEKSTNGSYRFQNIHYILYVSETHLYDQNKFFTTTLVGPASDQSKSVGLEFINYLVHSWASYNNQPLTYIPQEEISWDKFVELKQSNTPRTKHELRREWYRLNPYLRSLSDDQLIQYGASLVKKIAPYMTVGGPRVPLEILGELTLLFGDYIEETNYKGIDLKEMKRYLT